MDYILFSKVEFPFQPVECAVWKDVHQGVKDHIDKLHQLISKTLPLANDKLGNPTYEFYGSTSGSGCGFLLYNFQKENATSSDGNFRFYVYFKNGEPEELLLREDR